MSAFETLPPPPVGMETLLGRPVFVVERPFRNAGSIRCSCAKHGRSRNSRRSAQPCHYPSVRGSSTVTVRCSVGCGVAVITLTPSGASKRCHAPCGTIATIPALSAKDWGPSAVMTCNVVAPSTICTISSPFGWRSQALSSANLPGVPPQRRQLGQLGIEINDGDHFSSWP